MAVAYESLIQHLKKVASLLPEPGEKNAGVTPKDVLRVLADL